MSNCVMVTSRVQATNIDALNRVAKAVTDMPNGTPITLAWSATAGSNVFTATKAGAGASGVYLAYSPEVNKLIVGKIWGGLDARTFIHVSNSPVACFKPHVVYRVLLT